MLCETDSLIMRQMTDYMVPLLEEAIKIELRLSELYQLFAEKIPEDKDFWWQLVLEEKNHAALLRSGKEFLKNDKFPSNFLPNSLEELKRSTQEILKARQKFNDTPARLSSFEIAYLLEHSAGEMHYQNYMSDEIDDDLRSIFKRLNRADIDHAKRIREYMSNIYPDAQD